MLLREKLNCHEINDFPKHFSADKTPYTETDFSDCVKKACLSPPPFMAGLRMCKVIVLGDVNVGKTSLVNRFCRQIFNYNYKATIGVDFEIEQFNILKVPFNMQIWDTAGQERFRCIASAYYRSAHVVVTTFDLTNVSSLNHCMIWMNEAINSSTDSPLKFLVGTKKDLMVDAAYSQVESKAVKVAKEMEAEFWAVSSRTGDGVKELFHRIAALSFDRVIKAELNAPSNQNHLCLRQDLSCLSKKNQTRPIGCEIGKKNCLN